MHTAPGGSGTCKSLLRQRTEDYLQQEQEGKAHLDIELAKDALASEALADEGGREAELCEAAGEEFVGLSEAEALDAAEELAGRRQRHLAVLQRAFRPRRQLLLVRHERSLRSQEHRCQQEAVSLSQFAQPGSKQTG